MQNARALEALSRRHLLQQPSNLGLQRLQLGINLLQRARRDVAVEIAVEVDLIADTANLAIAGVAVALIHPGIGHEGRDLARDVVLPILLERHQLVIA